MSPVQCHTLVCQKNYAGDRRASTLLPWRPARQLCFFYKFAYGIGGAHVSIPILMFLASETTKIVTPLKPYAYLSKKHRWRPARQHPSVLATGAPARFFLKMRISCCESIKLPRSLAYDCLWSRLWLSRQKCSPLLSDTLICPKNVAGDRRASTLLRWRPARQLSFSSECAFGIGGVYNFMA